MVVVISVSVDQNRGKTPVYLLSFVGSARASPGRFSKEAKSFPLPCQNETGYPVELALLKTEKLAACLTAVCDAKMEMPSIMTSTMAGCKLQV